MAVTKYDLLLALILTEPSAIASNKTAADHIFSVAFLLLTPSVYFERFKNPFPFICLLFCLTLLVAYKFTKSQFDVLYF